VRQLILQVFATLGGVGVLLATLGLLFRHYLETWITARVNARAEIDVGKAVESYKHELSKSLEHYRSGLALEAQRALQEHNLFAIRRQEVWAKLYALVLTAEGKALSIRGRYVAPRYEDYELSDLLELARAEGCPSGTVNELEYHWKTVGQDAAIKFWKECEWRKRWNEALTAWDEAHDYLVFNALYLSDTLHDLANAALEPTWDYVGEMEVPPDPTERAAIHTLKVAMRTKVHELKQALRSEMRAAYLADRSDANLVATSLPASPPPALQPDRRISPARTQTS
jgi:hypothetical protein